MEKAGGIFLQAESEISAINMVYGAAGAGFRAMTSSSSPGISLKQEGIAYIAGSELPCVIVNVMRVGPGLGGIQPAQSDYFQATKGGVHGDYRMVVLTPNSVQELFDFTLQAFDIADEYRNPVMLLADGILGQMMETVDLYTPELKTYDKPWATTGTEKIREHNIINSLYIQPEESEAFNQHLQAKYKVMMENEQRVEIINPDADIMIVAFGIVSRVAKQVIDELENEGFSVGLIRPQRVWPFPTKGFERIAKAYLVTEMNSGQMVEDVKLGTTEIVHAAARGENITVIFVNNAIYGMTGGQMAPTTLSGQVTLTTPYGRRQSEGFPIKMSEMLSVLDGTRYIERVSVHDPKNIIKAGKAIKKAFEMQLKGEGFSMIEVLSSCPTNLKLTPLKALTWVEENMIPYYPLGVLKDGGVNNAC
jgi:2-oxoglutarate/2-oxoacid ferredoxin oxidoreductase subunit alpha